MSGPGDRTLSLAALAALCFSVFVSVTNASMSSLLLPDLQLDFNLQDDELSWFVVLYLIPFAIGTVVFGKLADIFGTRKLFLLAMTLFAAASIAVALAPTYPAILAARTLQGLAGPATAALSLATIVKTLEGGRRSTAIGSITMAVGIGFGVGPLAGGLLTDAFGWPGPLYATGGLSAGLVVALALTLPDVPGTGDRKFDFAGSVLLAGTVTAALVALNRLPNEPGDALGLFGAAAILPFAALLAVRLLTAANPIVRPRLLKNFRFLSLCVVGFCIQGAHFAMVVLIPLLLQRYHGLEIFEIGLRLLPGALTLAAMGILAGRLSRRLGTRLFLVFGTWLLFNAGVTFVVAGAGWGTWAIAGVYVAVTAGYGMVNATVISAATDELPESESGTGIGVYNLLFFLGGAVAVAAQGAILRLRAGEFESWFGIYAGPASEFADAGFVVVALGTLGFLITMALGPTGSAQSAHDIRTQGQFAPAFFARQKPNKGASD